MPIVLGIIAVIGFLIVVLGIPAIIAINVLDVANNGLTFWPIFWLALIFFGSWALSNSEKK